MNAPQQMPTTGDNPMIPFAPRQDTRFRLRAGFPGAGIHVSEQDRPLFAALRDSLFCSVQPKTGLEGEVFGHLVNSAWQLHRVAQWEGEMASKFGNPFLKSDCGVRLCRLQKYKSGLERTFRIATAELRKLQTERDTRGRRGELAEAQVSAAAHGAAVTCIAQARCVPDRFSAPHAGTLAGGTRQLLGVSTNVRQMPQPRPATAA